MTLTMYKLIHVCSLLILSGSVLSSTDLQDSKVPNSSTQRIAEAGILSSKPNDQTHLGREHVVENVKSTTILTKTLNNTQHANETDNKTLSNTTANTVKPVTEKSEDIALGVPKKNDKKHSGSVGKKGVSLDVETNGNSLNKTTVENNTTNLLNKQKTPATTTATSTTTTTKAPIPKPLITEHDNYNAVVSETDELKSNEKLSGIDTLLQKKSNRANYVIPIVAVILSVPLVAIIISALYKRGTDWWQHRNYRRMDFLIEGMYNN